MIIIISAFIVIFPLGEMEKTIKTKIEDYFKK